MYDLNCGYNRIETAEVARNDDPPRFAGSVPIKGKVTDLTRQQTRFLSLMEGYKQAAQYANDAANSTGIAAEKLEIYQDSIEAKANKMAAAFEKLSQSALPAALIGGIYDLGTAVINFGASVDGIPATIATMVASLMTLKTAVSMLQGTKLGTTILNTGKDLGAIVKTLNAIGVATSEIAAINATAGESVATLASAFSVLTPTQIKNLAVSQQLSKAAFIEAVSRSSLSDELKEETINLYLSATAKKTEEGATKGLTVANLGLKSSFIGLGTVMKTHPLMTFFTILSIAIPIITAIADKLIVTTEELKEQVDNTVGEISSMQSELDTTRSRIAELEGIDSLSLIEQEELNKLKTENEYLEAQIRLLEEKKRIEGQEYNESLTQDFKKQMSETFGTGNYIEAVDDGGNTILVSEQIARTEAYKRSIAYLREIQDEKAKYADMSADELELYKDEIAALNEKEKAAKEFVAETGDMFRQYANDLVVVDEESKRQRDEYVKQATEAANAVKGIFWSEDTTQSFNKVFNQQRFGWLKRELLDLAAQGKLTVSTLEAPEYAELIMALEDAGVVGEDTGITLEHLATHISAVATASGDASGNLSSLSTTLTGVVDKLELVNGVQQEFQEAGRITSDTLSKILEVYGDGASTDLTQNVAEYIAGLRSAEELLSDLQDAYEKDEQAYLRTIKNELSASSTFYSKLSDAQKSAVAGLAAQYGVDLENFKTVEQKKLAAQAQMMKAMLSNYSIYANKDTEYIQERVKALSRYEMQGHLSHVAKEELAAARQYLNAIDSFNKAFDDIVFEGLDIPGVENFIELDTSSKTVELYIADINKLYDAERRLFDLQKEYDLIAAKRDLLDDDDLEGHIKAANELTESLRKQNEILHEQNNIRDGMIQSEIGRIKKVFADQGIDFNIDYDSLNNALNIKDWEKINELTAGTTEETNELRKEIEESLKQIMEWNEANVDGSLQWWKNLKSIDDILDDIKSSMQEVLDAQHESLTELLELVIERIKQEKEDEKEALEAQLDDYKSIIDARKELLQLAKRENEYADDIAEKTKRLAEIERRLAALAQDDSREARLEEGALKEEQAELQKELSKAQADHYVESAEEALDKELEAFEDAQDKKIDEIDDFLDDNEKLQKEALLRLDNMNEALYDQLLAYAKKYTDTSSAELQKMWDDALAAAKEYGSYTDALTKTDTEVSDAAATDALAHSLVSQMRANASKWHNASPSEQADLQEENENIRDALEELLGKEITRDGNGVWWIGNHKLFEKYHSGTPSVGNIASKKQNETFALLDNTEMVLTQKHQNNLWNMLSAWAPIASLKSSLSGLSITGVAKTPAMAGGPNITINAPFNVVGDLNDEMRKAFRNQKREIAEAVSAQLRKP